jgi:acetyl-CoA synthetase
MKGKHLPTVSKLMNENRAFPPPDKLREKAYINSFQQYLKNYEESIEDPDGFFLEKAKMLSWAKFPTQGLSYNWKPSQGDVWHRWFEDGKINVCYNCVDRHVENGLGHKTALLWQGEDDQEVLRFSYEELLLHVKAFANVLKKHGVKKGDRVCIYMPMVPELAISMLATCRIGAIHSIVFGGFSAESLSHRIQDAGCRIVITANVALRGGKQIPLKETVDAALIKCDGVDTVLVYQRTQDPCSMIKERDYWLHEELKSIETESCPVVELNAEDPLFILYTSGSTGKPKGVVHTQGGYLLHAALTHKLVFDVHEEDIYWCTADIGWITGHSYVIYGPLCNATTTLMFEGIPTFPNPSRFWQVIDKHKVNIFYTAPTAIRALMREGEAWPKKYSLASLRILGTVGEPINPEAWMWYHQIIGKGKLPIVDTWWQTETGGIMITPLPGCHILHPGSASYPFFGVDAVILRDDGMKASTNEGGNLCITKPWPGIMRTTWGDHQRFIDTYFRKFEGKYFSGDGCRIDEEGNFWLLGRIDDVVNISGHRIGTAEVESALVSHSAVAEAAVVSVPHEIKGESLVAYVTLIKEFEPNSSLDIELKKHVRKEIGPIAVPDVLHFTPKLPKTRSGKIMRRILRKIARKEYDSVGDISTLADPSVIAELSENKEE